MAERERAEGAQETAGALTGMWERTYGRRSLFRNFNRPGAQPGSTAPAAPSVPFSGPVVGGGSPSGLQTNMGTLPITLGGMGIKVKPGGSIYDQFLVGARK